MSLQLTRSETDRVIAGVAGGLAKRLGVSSTLVRLAWVVSAVFGGFSILLYVILWIALPKSAAHHSATQIAAERYARGEITRDEFLERCAVLERTRPDAAPGVIR